MNSSIVIAVYIAISAIIIFVALFTLIDSIIDSRKVQREFKEALAKLEANRLQAELDREYNSRKERGKLYTDTLSESHREELVNDICSTLESNLNIQFDNINKQ